MQRQCVDRAEVARSPLDDGVVAVASRIHVGVVARAAGKRVVALAATDHVIGIEAVDDVVAICYRLREQHDPEVARGPHGAVVEDDVLDALGEPVVQFCLEQD